MRSRKKSKKKPPLFGTVCEKFFHNRIFPFNSLTNDRRLIYNNGKSAVYGVRLNRNPHFEYGSGEFAAIGKVCIDTESPTRRDTAPTCLRRVSLFSECGTGGFFLRYHGEILKKFYFFYFLTAKTVALPRKMCYTTIAIERRPYGQAVKTTPSHGVNPGSSPGKVTKKILNRKLFGLGFFLFIATERKTPKKSALLAAERFSLLSSYGFYPHARTLNIPFALTNSLC